jgi:hypothetical protein
LEHVEDDEIFPANSEQVIRKKGPGIAGGHRLREKDAASFDEVLSVPVPRKGGFPFYPSNNDTVEQTGSIESCVTGHDGMAPSQGRTVNQFLSF